MKDSHDTLTYGGAKDAAAGTANRLGPGQIFDRRYRIIEEIGRGGMGYVYKAEDTELDITVALKIIRPDLSSNPRFIEQFKKEMLLARSISHENVIRIFDLGEAAGTKYISMEYIKGENLEEFIHTSGILSLETVIHLARQVGEALRIAHDKGIIHQDIKPSNIMVDQSGQVYVMDFGLATAVYGADAGKAGEVAGTPKYMSPEQALGRKTGPASDIYSFGAILYEMATGKPVFEAKTRAEYKAKHVSEQPVSPAKKNPRLPKRLDRVILKCLNKNPEERYPTIAAVLGDLSKVPGPAPRSPIEWLKRSAAWTLAAAGTAAVAAFVYLLWIRPPPPPERRPSLAVVYLTNNTGESDLDYMRRMLSELLIADLLQSQYVRVLTPDKIYGTLKSLNLLEAPAFSSEELTKIAAKARVNYILQGNFSKALNQFRIDTTLHRADSLEVLGAQREQWTGEEAQFIMIESLSRKIKESLNVPASALAKDIHKDLKKIQTASSDAFKFYVEGKRLFEEQKFEQSLDALQKAVSLDPEYAMAFRLMAENYGYLRDGERYEINIRKALSLLDRVSDRDFYMIRGFAATTPREAVEMYQKLLRLYPDDIDALGELGAQYRNLEQWALAARQFEQILGIDDTDELTYENLAVIYMAQGHLQKVIDLLESKLDVFSDWFSFHNRLATAYLCAHRYDRALEEALKAEVLEPGDFESFELEGLIHLLQDDPVGAEACFRRMTGVDNPLFQTVGRNWLCQLYLGCGRYERAMEEVLAGLEHARMAQMSPELQASERHLMGFVSAYVGLQTNGLPQALRAADEALEQARLSGRPDYIGLSLQFRGLILARMKRFEEARAAAGELKDFIETYGLVNELRHHHHVVGEIAREEGDLTKAIGLFEAALDLLPCENYKTDIHILYLDSLASAHLRNGDGDLAREYYERIGSLTTGRLRMGDLYAKSFYALGKIHQTRKQNKRAVESYRRFLEVWRQADPTLPEIADARKQLTALGASPPF